MATYIVMLDFTDQGVRNIAHTTERADAFAAAVENAGGKVKDQYWTVGSHDGVLIVDLPDDQTAAALVLTLGSLGNVRTQLLRAYDRSEVDAILARVPLK